MSAAPITCKAVVAFGPKLPLQVVDIIVALPRAGEVRLKVVASAVCAWSEDPYGAYAARSG